MAIYERVDGTKTVGGGQLSQEDTLYLFFCSFVTQDMFGLLLPL